MLRHLTGMYAVLRGTFYLFEAVLVFSTAVSSSALDLFVGTGLAIASLFLLFAGSGLAVGHIWAHRFAVIVLGLDVLRMVGAFALALNPVDVVWGVLSLVVVCLLVFKNPFEAGNRPELDEDATVHGMTSYRN